MTRRGLSFEAVFFSSANILRETLYCDKSFAVIREEVPAEGLFEKEPDSSPSEIHNSTAPPSSPGDPIEAGVFNVANWAEDISLVRNQRLGVDDDMEPSPDNVPLVHTPASDTLFEVQTWGWDGIYIQAVLTQNQNEPSFRNGWIPQILSYTNIFLNFLPLKWLIIFLLP